MSRGKEITKSNRWLERAGRRSDYRTTKILKKFLTNKKVNAIMYLQGKEKEMVPNPMIRPIGQKEVFFMATTMTKVEKFNAIAKAIEGMTFEGFDAQEFLTKEIEMTEKRNSRKSNSKTKTQKENDALKPEVLKTLEGGAMTATEVKGAMGLSSTQKASALLKQLVDSGEVVKSKGEKGKTLFGLAKASEDTTEE